VIGFARHAQGGMAGAKKRRAGNPDSYKSATGRKRRAHEQDPEFEIPYYRYQCTSCQAVPFSVSNDYFVRDE
jgi:hypothetical protein